MVKRMEKTDRQSCWNKADNDELVFVLLGRDKAAPHAIREWARERVRIGKNKMQDHQIQEALNAAKSMERAQTLGTATAQTVQGRIPPEAKK
jgi:hypothetical protein